MADQSKDQRVRSESFLLEDFRYLGEAFLRNEELGERRVNFFITLTTAVVGALVAIWKVVGKVDQLFFCVGLLAVFLFGIVTLVRIIRRNIVTDEYLRALGRIRKYFADRDPQIEPFLAYPACDDKARTKKWKDILSFGTGGLIEMVQLVNSLVLGAVFALSAHCQPKLVIFTAAVIGFLIAYVGQFGYIRYRYGKQKRKIEKEIRFPCPKGD